MAMLLLAAAVFLGLLGKDMTAPQQVKGVALYDKVLYFPLSRYPETGDHIRDAIAEGHSDICTIDRDGADKRREESLKEFRRSLATIGMNGRWQFVKKEVPEPMSDM